MKTHFLSLLILIFSSQAFAGKALFKVVSKFRASDQISFSIQDEDRVQYTDQKLFSYLESSKLGLKPSSAVFTSEDKNYKSFVATKANDRGREEFYYILFDITAGNSEWRTPSAMKMPVSRKLQELKRGETVDLEKADIKIVGE